ncbi:YqaJ viral recombinase family protein, partial [Clostridium sp.]|uniref:YqaJ viral recombinase family protein n=1 Tax=Clostridium sp. TaxID=1506 RepID=UPI00290D3D12
MVEILTNTKDMTNEEWLEWRKKGIGGSDVATICGLNKYKSALELWMEKRGYKQDEEAGESAYWGTTLEHIVREEFI